MLDPIGLLIPAPSLRLSNFLKGEKLVAAKTAKNVLPYSKNLRMITSMSRTSSLLVEQLIASDVTLS